LGIIYLEKVIDDPIYEKENYRRANFDIRDQVGHLNPKKSS